jgi:hypothetical protein
VPVPSNEREVMNRFDNFKFFDERTWIEEFERYVDLLDEAERSERRDSSAAQGYSHDHASKNVT